MRTYEILPCVSFCAQVYLFIPCFRTILPFPLISVNTDVSLSGFPWLSYGGKSDILLTVYLCMRLWWSLNGL